MNIGNVLNQLLGSNNNSQSNTNALGGLAGGALAGGAAALLLGNKQTRKFVGNVATVGGAALIGTVAYKAYQNWQSQKPVTGSSSDATLPQSIPETFLPSDPKSQSSLKLTLVKAMIAAAKIDGYIDPEEQARIFKEVQTKEFTEAEKATVFDLLSKTISVDELSSSVNCLEQKAEVYLVSYLICKGDTPQEKQYLSHLSSALGIPSDLVAHLESQAS